MAKALFALFDVSVDIEAGIIMLIRVTMLIKNVHKLSGIITR
jgi:hypothetical protein